MTMEDYADEYAVILANESKWRDARKLLEFRMKIECSRLKEYSKIDLFIEKHKSELEFHQINFLQNGQENPDKRFDSSEAGTQEVMEHTGFKKDKVCKRLRDGVYDPGPRNKEKRNTYDRISVIEVEIGLRHDGEAD